MGIEDRLNAAALKQENLWLRAELARAQGMLRAISARDRAMEMEARFIAAMVPAITVIGDDRTYAMVIEGGRKLARMYIEQLSAEAEAERVEAEVPAPEGGLVVVPGMGDEN